MPGAHFKEVCKVCKEVLDECRGCAKKVKPVTHVTCQKCIFNTLGNLGLSMFTLRNLLEVATPQDPAWRTKMNDTMKDLGKQLNKL